MMDDISSATRHSENFPDPTQPEEGRMRVWFAPPQRYLFISVDDLREAKLVIKTITALTGLADPRYVGVQWYQPDQGWIEWTGADGTSIHDLPDTDEVFAPSSKAVRQLLH